MLLRGDTLHLFYTRKADAPERILVSTVRLTDDWTQWAASEPVEVLRPEEQYEGTRFSVCPLPAFVYFVSTRFLKRLT